MYILRKTENGTPFSYQVCLNFCVLKLALGWRRITLIAMQAYALRGSTLRVQCLGDLPRCLDILVFIMFRDLLGKVIVFVILVTI